MDCIDTSYDMPALSEGPASSKDLVRNSQTPQGIIIATAIETKLLAAFGDHLLFRGLSRQALLSLVAVFYPFGPGFYANPSVRAAARYAGPNGVILVFKRLSEIMTKLTPSGQDGETCVRFWTGIPVGKQDSRVPANCWGADVLKGAISVAVSSRDSRRAEEPNTQAVGVSLESSKVSRHIPRDYRC
ncbi:hypothetical protein N7533_006606 [Penicillium manginii]|uniref:uncharacterized protein n=1 Tax=Penicillium manginii TaxID=203109 RepID=UPI0025478953|nr:uncharacterized protein N7533_006606 [Penicillium manginii]KAJ5749578.1 hypothetical protein N7533_006606 [Penicillium manginii]